MYKRRKKVNQGNSVMYRMHENVKKREYGDRIREVERGAFTPLVLSTTGRMARECTIFYKRLADRLAEKRKTNYSLMMRWLRCRISFALLRSAIRALQGSRSSINALAPLDIQVVSRKRASAANFSHQPLTSHHLASNPYISHDR